MIPCVQPKALRLIYREGNNVPLGKRGDQHTNYVPVEMKSSSSDKDSIIRFGSEKNIQNKVKQRKNCQRKTGKNLSHPTILQSLYD